MIVDWFSSRRLDSIEDRLNNLAAWRAWFNGRITEMAGELEALKAAVAADAEMDAKFMAAVDALVTKVADLTAKLNDLALQPAILPEDVQAVADQLQAHVNEMAAHLPADSSGAA